MAISKIAYNSRFNYGSITNGGIWEYVREKVGNQYLMSLDKCCEVYGPSFGDFLKDVGVKMRVQTIQYIGGIPYINSIVFDAAVMHFAYMDGQ